MTNPDAALQVENLRVEVRTPRGWIPAVDGISFCLHPGDMLGLAGESGSGKSLAVLAVMGLLPAGARTASGTVRLDGVDLLAGGQAAWRTARGRRVAMVFQEPQSALNPVLTAGTLAADAQRAHGLPVDQGRMADLLGRVGLDNPARVLRSYPHQLSGGMRQRVLIALALLCGASFLLADEPTTALDASTAAEVLGVLDRLRLEAGLGVLLVSHDLGLLATRASRVAVMYAGRIVEEGPASAVVGWPRHPYAHGLQACSWSLRPPGAGAGARLPVLPGAVPGPADRGTGGCAFAPRCDAADDRCHAAAPDLAEVAAGHSAACWHPRAGAAA
ncbi:MAG: ABC transporter ATP-binding protein [Deltaproteobacteria bacterium]|nr:ABC transporter ATP-binding protein [Deltaproteobacteria bacterium]